MKLSGRVCVVAASATLIAPASAAAKSVVYAGTTSGGGKIAMDVRVSSKGKPKRITEIRGVDIPIECEQSGAQKAYVTIPVDLKVNRSGGFSFANEDSYGNESSILGDFKGRKAKTLKGIVVYANHFQAEGDLPEENCGSSSLTYKIKKGAPDVVPPAPPPSARR